GPMVREGMAATAGGKPHEKIQRIRSLRPDMILLSGGVDGGTVSHVVELAELLVAADPKARLGSQFSLPVVYAGNKDARALVEERLAPRRALSVTGHLRPTLEQENLAPAPHQIPHLFIEPPI